MSTDNIRTDLETCLHCAGTGKVPKRNAVTPWGTWQQRATLARDIKAGDRWIQIKSGRVAVATGPVDGYGCVPLRHENGRTTTKWRSYFGQEFTPETPPEVT